MKLNLVTGTEKLINALKAHPLKLEKGVERGVVRAGLWLQRASMKIVPVDLGNLRASCSTRKEGTGFATEAFVVYTSEYAIFVHEDLTAQHAPGKEAKYLEKPAKEGADTIAKIIQDSAVEEL